MADQKLAAGSVGSTTLTTVFDPEDNSPGRIYSFWLTNTTSSRIDIDIYYNDGTSRLLTTVNLPGGSGKSVFVSELQGSFSGGDSVALQASNTNTFNYLVTGRYN